MKKKKDKCVQASDLGCFGSVVPLKIESSCSMLSI